ncbi:hypothetical protein pb186bvf_001154 [Paramecium bursaria]
MDHHNTFQMMGQNMFAQSPPTIPYLPVSQAQRNQQNYNQLLSMMDMQKQQVSDYNMRMREKEEYLMNLDKQQQANQLNMINQDRDRNNHNQIKYNQYAPDSLDQGRQYAPEPQYLQEQQVTASRYYSNPKIQQIDNQYHQPIPQPQMGGSFQKQNTQLDSIYKQIEEQNEYLRQLTEMMNKKPTTSQQPNDSLEMMVKMKEEQKQIELLNELKELRRKVENIERNPPQPFQINPIPQQFPMQYPMYYPPPPMPMPQHQPQQNQEDHLFNEMMMQMLKKNRSKQKRRRHTPRDSQRQDSVSLQQSQRSFK